ncbi:hypothetical protein F7Q99_36550 [Streptomyces kaniharaensis]|uniref:Uncharacterized protein n=1 Tax=Streptomyces kaniharaensis TaxID=212423 RepID=A0A6N7L659_9ACTN|nr:hypothetical protein [Streptomyces kaniharaensis]MQS17553.1 hypothetical protein [Streptomyces kaniharaensis]
MSTPTTSRVRLDPVLADRVMDAQHLAGLPIAHGGHGPGVHVRPAEPLNDDDACRGLIALHWLPSRRLAAAAATEQHRQPAHYAQQLVVNTVQHALTVLLPHLGTTAARAFQLWEVRVTAAVPLPHELTGLPGPRPSGPQPIASGIRPDVTTAVRRSAALAGLPVATHPGDPGITLRPCPPLDVDDDTAGIADLGWNPSRRLAAATSGTAWNLRTAVEDAVRQALPVALGACGLDVWWRRPDGLPPQLRAYGPSEDPPIRR